MRLALVCLFLVACNANCSGAQKFERAEAIGEAELSCVQQATASYASQIASNPAMTPEQRHMAEALLAIQSAWCMIKGVAAKPPAAPPAPAPSSPPPAPYLTWDAGS